jgi:uncharacterized protein YebE (UPF0316 family)
MSKDKFFSIVIFIMFLINAFCYHLLVTNHKNAFLVSCFVIGLDIGLISGYKIFETLFILGHTRKKKRR